MFRNILIIGLGLMGGSLALAFRQKRMTEIIQGYDASEAIMEKAFRTGLINKKAEQLAEAVIEADLVIICSHLASYPEIAKAISRFPKAGALITDIGSVKSPAVKLESFLTSEQKKNYVSSHPITGSENSGLPAIKPDLFAGKKVIITPFDNSTAKTLQTITKMWQSLGSNPEVMPADLHDIIYAGVSHVPQFLCWCYADFLAATRQKPENPEENFSRFMRLSGSNPALWQDIFLANNKNISRVLADFYLNFSNIMREIEAGQNDELLTRFTNAIATRENMNDPYDYRETAWDAEKFDTITMVPRIIALAFLEVAGNTEYGGPGFLDFTRIIISDPLRNVDYLMGAKYQVFILLQRFFNCMDNFYKIVERNTRPDILLKMTEARGNYLAALGKE